MFYRMEININILKGNSRLEGYKVCVYRIVFFHLETGQSEGRAWRLPSLSPDHKLSTRIAVSNKLSLFTSIDRLSYNCTIIHDIVTDAVQQIFTCVLE